MQEQYDLTTEYRFREKDKSTDIERISSLRETMYITQIYGAALLEHQSLLMQINALLRSHAKLAPYSLVVPLSAEPYRIFVDGGIKSVVAVEFFAVGTFAEEQAVSKQNNDTLIFLGQRDFGELAPATPSQEGEFYRIVGDPFLGRLFWPFLINLDATCFAINDPYSPILDVECSEK
jgi:hypothetical protein